MLSFGRDPRTAFDEYQSRCINGGQLHRGKRGRLDSPVLGRRAQLRLFDLPSKLLLRSTLLGRLPLFIFAFRTPRHRPPSSPIIPRVAFVCVNLLLVLTFDLFVSNTRENVATSLSDRALDAGQFGIQILYLR